MHFELDEDVTLLRDNVREFCRQHIVPHAGEWDERGALPADLRGKLGELGLLGLCLPEDRGGTGLSMVATVAVLEEIAFADASVATLVAVHNVLGLGALALGGEDLAELAAGSSWVGFADDASLQAAPQGDAVQLRGRAGFIIGGDDTAVVVAAAAGDAGGLYRIGKAAGTTNVESLGLRAAPIAEASFDGTTLAAADKLGDEQAAAALRDAGRIALAAVLVGQGTAALRAGRDYALEREQFGKPIAKFQAIQWKVADAAVGLDAARLLTLKAAALLDRGESFAAAAARAKLKAGAAAVAAGSHALQIHGGYGYTREFPVERALRNARVLDALLGGARAHRSTASDSILNRFTD